MEHNGILLWEGPGHYGVYNSSAVKYDSREQCEAGGVAYWGWYETAEEFGSGYRIVYVPSHRPEAQDTDSSSEVVG